MRKIVSKFFWPTIEILIVGIFIVLVMPKNNNEKLVFTVLNSDSIKMIDTSSSFFVDDSLIDTSLIKEELNDEVILTEENLESDNNVLVIEEEVVDSKNIKEEEVNLVDESTIIDVSNYPVLNTYTNLVMTGYGYDCRGCTTGKTASGYSIENTIYYDDPTFGELRIIAMDKSIPLYSVVRLSNIFGMEPILAIVLDRGGGIGFDKSIQIDLVVESEAIAKETIGKISNITCEILRNGK